MPSFDPLRIIIALPMLALAVCATAQDSTITYQGQLRDGGTPVTGNVNLEFRLYDELTGGNPIGTEIQRLEWPVEDGLFQVELDFGAAAFDGGERFLEVEVNGAPLSPRQRVTAVPFALRAARTVAGAVGGTEIDSTQVQLRIDGACAPGAYVQAVNEDGTLQCGAEPPGWNLGGNAGTDPSTDFLGTTDATALELRAGNARGLRIEPSAELLGGQPVTSNIIGGSSANEVVTGVKGATIAGGGVPSSYSDPLDFGENPNQVTADFGFVGGGYGNTAGDGGSSPGTARFTTVGGGVRNTASGASSTVGGGKDNTASGRSSTVVGGVTNTASGAFSTVSGGLGNCAGPAFSWAGGYRAKVRPGSESGDPGDGCDGIPTVGQDGDRGTFVWADRSLFFEDFVSTGDNQFLVRAAGGVGINTNAPDTELHVVGAARAGTNDFWQIIAESDETTGAAGTGGGISFLGNDGDGTRRLWGYIENVKENSTAGNIRSRMSFYTRGPTLLPEERLRIDSDGAVSTPNGSFSTPSDRRLKEEIEPLSGALDQLLGLNGVRFRYRAETAPFGDTDLRMGFVAQQVEQVIPEWVSENGEGYKQVTPTGFRALTVEALRDLRDEKDFDIAQLSAENAELRAQLAEVQTRQRNELTDLRAELAMLRELVAPRVAEATRE